MNVSAKLRAAGLWASASRGSCWLHGEAHTSARVFESSAYKLWLFEPSQGQCVEQGLRAVTGLQVATSLSGVHMFRTSLWDAVYSPHAKFKRAGTGYEHQNRLAKRPVSQ